MFISRFFSRLTLALIHKFVLIVLSNSWSWCWLFYHWLILVSHISFILMQRPFACPVDDCHASFKRKDHLTRHSLSHQGKLFACPVSNCNCNFGFKGNIKRHVREIHEDESPCEGQQQYVCGEPGCGKTFKYPSKLKKHEDSHGKILSFKSL